MPRGHCQHITTRWQQRVMVTKSQFVISLCSVCYVTNLHDLNVIQHCTDDEALEIIVTAALWYRLVKIARQRIGMFYTAEICICITYRYIRYFKAVLFSLVCKRTQCCNALMKQSCVKKTHN